MDDIMHLDEVIEILEEMIILDNLILLPGEKLSDFDKFIYRRNRAIVAAVKELKTRI